MKPRKDIKGKTFERLTALEYIGGGKWRCECSCGKITEVTTNALLSGNTKSCGCLNTEKIHAKQRNSKDLTGKTYGSLKVLEYVRSGDRGTVWLCECSLCGSRKEFVASDLKHIKSCGCLEKQSARENIEALHSEIRETGTNPKALKREKSNKNNSTTGIKGVCKIHSGGREYYVAYIQFQGKRYMLKRSVDIEECIKARKEAEKKLHKDFLQWYEECKKK